MNSARSNNLSFKISNVYTIRLERYRDRKTQFIYVELMIRLCDLVVLLILIYYPKYNIFLVCIHETRNIYNLFEKISQ